MLSATEMSRNGMVIDLKELPQMKRSSGSVAKQQRLVKHVRPANQRPMCVCARVWCVVSDVRLVGVGMFLASGGGEGVNVLECLFDACAVCR